MTFERAMEACIIAGNPYKTVPTESYAGIERGSYPFWDGWLIIDRAKKTADFLEEIRENKALKTAVEDHYKRFFDALMLEQIQHDQLALELFEGSAAVGRRLAVRMLEEAVNLVTVDYEEYYPITPSGEMSVELVNRLNKFGDKKGLYMAYLVLIGGKYVSQPAFFKRWISE